MRLARVSCVALSAVPMLTMPITAQRTDAAIPQVVTTGRGEVTLRPDRARVDIGVETRAQTVAMAVSENSRRQRLIIDTLQRAGVSADQIQTDNLQVTPELVYPTQGQSPKVAGYSARNSVRVEILKIEQAGSLVDAALLKGATNISNLEFYSSREQEARREALAKAVVAARADAEAISKAAGYQLGGVVELSSAAPSSSPVFRIAETLRPRLAAMAEPTPISPGEIKISETVTVRWMIKQ